MKSKAETATAERGDFTEHLFGVRRLAEMAATNPKARAAFRRPAYLLGVAVILREAEQRLLDSIPVAADFDATHRALLDEAGAQAKRGASWNRTLGAIVSATERAAGEDLLPEMFAVRVIVEAAVRDPAAAKWLAAHCRGLAHLLRRVDLLLTDCNRAANTAREEGA